MPVAPQAAVLAQYERQQHQQQQQLLALPAPTASQATAAAASGHSAHEDVQGAGEKAGEDHLDKEVEAAGALGDRAEAWGASSALHCSKRFVRRPCVRTEALCLY